MEHQRTRVILSIALVFIGGLLFSKWQAQHKVKVQPHIISGIVETASVSDSDVPDIDINSSNSQTTSVEAIVPLEENKISAAQLVNVNTDLFNIKIDLKGGDILELKLPEYPTELNAKNKPYTLFSKNNLRWYFPQTGLISREGPDTRTKGRGMYSSAQKDFNLVGDTLRVPLTWSNQSGVIITKTYVFKKGNYAFDIEYDIKNTSDVDWEGRAYNILKRKEPPKAKGIVGMRTFTGAAIFTPEKSFKKIKFKHIKKEPLDRDLEGGWSAMMEHYFVSAFIPASNEIHHYFTKFSKGTYQVGSYSPKILVATGTNYHMKTTLYAGPEKTDNLRPLAKGLDLTIDFGFLWPISITILWILKKVFAFVGNWGLSIILVTLMIKIMFYKLSAKSYHSMANMRKVQPKIQALKERYGDDRQAMTQEMMSLYKKEKINPLGGCLPIVIQIPVFIALYYVLLESIEFRHAPFLFWIQDLSAKDPFYVLPILMGASMLIQQRLNPTPPDPVQAKMMMMMPVVFTALFLNFPSGLVLYWVTNNTLSILQQWYITRQIV